MIMKFKSSEGVGVDLLERRLGKGKERQGGEEVRRLKKNVEETAWISKLVMVGETQKIFDQSMDFGLMPQMIDKKCEWVKWIY